MTTTRYRFGEPGRVGVVLGMSLRQTAPLVVGVLWFTTLAVLGLPIVGALGPLAGIAVAFGRYRRAPLYEVAGPGAKLAVARATGSGVWRRASLPSDSPVAHPDVPAALKGLHLIDTPATWQAVQTSVGVVHDRSAGTLSLVLPVRGEGFPVASAGEQDALVAGWGAALSPVARARCPVARLTWQEWSHPVGVDGHRHFLNGAGAVRPHVAANSDYSSLLDQVAPFTIAHDIHLTVTVDMRRVRARRGSAALAVGTDALIEETRQLASRLEVSGFKVDAPLTPAAITAAVRLRCDPYGGVAARQSLAALTGRAAAEWGPMAVEPGWFEARVDKAWHRSFAIAAWPMLPVGADWLGPLLTVDDVTRTVTVVFEPVPLAAQRRTPTANSRRSRRIMSRRSVTGSV